MAERGPDPPLRIRPLADADGPAVVRIYREGIDGGHATFQEDAGNWASWCAGHLERCRLGAELAGALVGWAGLSGVSSRCVYAGVAEVSIYVARAARGRGVGRRLLAALVAASEEAGIWTLQAGIFPENAASVALHRAAGFRPVGTRERIGRMRHGPLAGAWRDVLLLERRSRVAGVD